MDIQKVFAGYTMTVTDTVAEVIASHARVRAATRADYRTDDWVLTPEGKALIGDAPQEEAEVVPAPKRMGRPPKVSE